MDTTERHRCRGSVRKCPQHNVPSEIHNASQFNGEVDRSQHLAPQNLGENLEREPQCEVEANGQPNISEENLHRATEHGNFNGPSEKEYDGDLSGRDREQHHRENRRISQPRCLESPTEDSSRKPESLLQEVSLHCTDVPPRQVVGRRRAETPCLQEQHEESSEVMERPDPLAGGPRVLQAVNKSDLVISSFNCEGWNDIIVLDLLQKISYNHTKSTILCCQETWRYQLSNKFLNEIKNLYTVVHETAMDPNVHRSRGRPFGGVCFIVSKDISFRQHYTDSRCLSIILLDSNTLLSNVYMPYNNPRISVDENHELYLQALGHLRASHDLANGMSNYITVGDFNYDPDDTSARANLMPLFLDEYAYTNTDLHCYGGRPEHTHHSGRILDRVVMSEHLSPLVSSIFVNKTFSSSDHYPVIAEISLIVPECSQVSSSGQRTQLNWKGASAKSIDSYSRLSNKLCKVSLHKFSQGIINGYELYRETIQNLNHAAVTCIPKRKYRQKSHSIPLWRERMSTYKDTVDFWLQTRFLEGGPNSCSLYVRNQLRRARSQYKRQLRQRRREIATNVADYLTERNCHKMLFKAGKVATPAIINGHNREEQPLMWRAHFQKVFKTSDTPCNGSDLLRIIDTKLNNDTSFCKFSIEHINIAINNINTDKSYSRHYHWKFLNTYEHSAKYSLCTVYNCCASDTMNNCCHDAWDLFDTNLSLVPKKGKKDLTALKAWRPISVGTSENWILEKVFLNRLLPFLGTSDCQFGYKEGHSTPHAIELVRILERSSDSHVCMLDASSAFDTLSWWRIRDQLLKRSVPLYLIKLCLKQLISNRISVCGTEFIFPRTGIKQGGILSGRYFSICYDDLVHDLRKVGAGVLITGFRNLRLLLYILVYADDIILIAKSPYGLSRLINVTLSFAKKYNDIVFNPGKSHILRLGRTRSPAVSVNRIPVTECIEYLGVMIGRGAKPQDTAAASLYCKANVMLSQNKELHNCSAHIKNLAVTTYGSVYALETFTAVGPRLRKAHRYVTRAVHTDWRTFVDLPGPNIRSRRLYTVYGLDSMEVLHRRRRNNFLIKAESSANEIIRLVIGSLPRITA